MCCTPSPPLPPISSSPCLPCPSSQNTVKMMVHVREADVYLTRFILRYVNTRLTLSNGKITAYQNSRRGMSDGSICTTFILSVNPKERVIRLVYMAYNGYASNFTLLYFTNCVNPKYIITQNKLLFHRSIFVIFIFEILLINYSITVLLYSKSCFMYWYATDITCYIVISLSSCFGINLQNFRKLFTHWNNCFSFFFILWCLFFDF